MEARIAPNGQPTERAAIVIGASAGGVEALRTVVAGLPPDIDAAVFVALHLGDGAPRGAILTMRAEQTPSA
jgi:chemotaxis response regulator CheB